jgi:small-conductance mechanosensitive channel
MGFLHLGLIKTFMAILAMFLVALAIESIFLKKIPSKRKKARSKVILRNIFIIILLFFLAKIWVDGFGHFLAVVGFISAALTITLKENILNLAGWLIIMWRHAFAEGDFISIQGTSGVVKTLGIFHFTLEEISGNNYNLKTGKLIKVPNSHVSLYPFVTYPIDHFVAVEEEYYFSFNTNLKDISLFQDEFKSNFNQFIQSLEIRFSHEEKKEYQKTIKKIKGSSPVYGLKVDQKNLKGFKFSVHCICLVQDQIEVRDYINALIIKIATASPSISFATEYGY